MSAVYHLPLVACEPYNARLTSNGCVRRHRRALGIAKSQKKTPGAARLVRTDPYTLCTECTVGAERAAETSPDVLATVRYWGALGGR